MDSKGKVLVIDDEFMPRYSIQQVLKDRYTVFTAAGGVEGLKFMAKDPADVVVVDIKMPDMDGITVLKEIKTKYPDTEVVLITAYASLESARSAVRLGAFDYLTKPFDKDDVMNIVEKGLQKKQAKEAIKLEREELLDKTVYLKKQITEAQQSLIKSYDGTVKALILTIDAKDHYTLDHSEHVAKLVYLIADALDLPDNEKNRLKHAGIMHDIGKIGTDERVLKKTGLLTPEEFTEMKKHPEIGARIIEAVPFLEDLAPIVRYHHEKVNGKGYPEGIKDKMIPLGAKIIAVADAIDAMTRPRPYRHALPIEKVLEELKNNAGTQFDAMLVELIFKEKIELK